MFGVKVIDKCNLDKNGNPNIVSGTAAMTMMYYFSNLYAEASSKNCNIVKRPLLTDMRTGEIVGYRVELAL